MHKSIWIGLGALILVLLLGCCGVVGWFGYSKAQELGRVLDQISQFEGEEYALNEQNNFRVYVKGGGELMIEEMWRRKGENFERWRPGEGWKVIQDKNEMPDFDLCDGYVFGRLENRALDDWVIHSALGPTEQFEDGRFEVCVEFYDPDSVYLEFADGESVTNSFFEIDTKKKGGGWASFTEFQFGKPGKLAEHDYISPFVERMNVEWLDGQAQGFFFKTSMFDFTMHEVRARFVMKDGTSEVVERWQFIDSEGEMWWFFPFEGRAEDVARVESMERAWKEFQIEGVEFETN